MTQEAEALKPCPHCGGAATFVKHEAGVRGTQGFDRWDAVACRSCGATVGACDRRFRNKDDAGAAWNRRPSPSEGTVEGLMKALQLAVRQNSHDMLMTGDELRQCEAAIRDYAKTLNGEQSNG